MSQTHVVIVGDTFESISRKFYGVDTGAARIREANPQVLAGGLSPGAVLTIPADNALPPRIRHTSPSEGENEVSVTVNGKPFRFWTDMTIERSIDSFDRFSLSAPYETSNTAFQEAFTPFEYQTVRVDVQGSPLFTGTMINSPVSFAPDGRTVTASGYATAGVWNDCTMPYSAVSLEFKDANLQTIATALGQPFGLLPVFNGLPDAAFPDTVKMPSAARVLTFLKRLAKQRNLVIGNDEFGQPVFQQSATGTPIMTLESGTQPVQKITPQFRPQEYYSHITALAPTNWLNEGVQATVENPHIRGTLRPFVFKVPETDAAGALVAAQATAGRMFGNTLSYKIDLAGWRDIKENLWKPNTLVRVSAPDVRIDNSTVFLIRSAELTRTGNKESCSLEIVLPDSFLGVVPEALPWDL